MSKTNIDNIVQDKLQDLNYDFKPEYWDKMENMLDSSSLSSSTNTAAATIFGSKIFLLSISSIFLIAGGIGAYFIFNSESEGSNDINNESNQIVLNGEQSEANINTNTTKVISQSVISSISEKNTTSEIEKNTTSEIVETSRIEDANIKSTKSYAVVSVEEIDSSTEDIPTEIINNVNIDDCDPCKETNIKEIDVVLMEDSNLKEIENIEEDDEIYVISKLNLIEKPLLTDQVEIIDTSKERQEEKVDDSKVKNVKPMRKPSGRVFRKKGGLLKRFGL